MIVLIVVLQFFLMTREKFRVVVSGIITFNGKILIGKKEDIESHPVGDEWILPGGHVDGGEDVEQAVKREIGEETDLDMEIHHLLDAYTQFYDSDREPMIRLFYHCESEKGDAKAKDDLKEFKWVKPEKLVEELGETDSEALEESDEVSSFLKKIEKMPVI